MNPGKKSKSRDHHRACFAEKSRAQHLIDLYMFLCFRFFLEMTLGDGPKNSRIRVKKIVLVSQIGCQEVFCVNEMHSQRLHVAYII